MLTEPSVDSFLVYFCICCSFILQTDEVTLKFEMKSILTLEGSSMAFSCSMSEPFNSNAIDIWKGDTLITTCRKKNDCNFYQYGYRFTSNTTGVFGCIRNVSAEDKGTWKCSYALTKGGYIDSNNWNLNVYSIPSGISITQNPNQDVDLSENQVVLQCKTVGCSYAMPTLLWIFKEQATSSENIYSTDNAPAILNKCTGEEKIYTSTLQIPQYTTFTDNSDKAGTFFCRIEYTDTFWKINSSASNTIRFTVHVRSVTLKPSGDVLNFPVGSNASLLCTASPSRPRSDIRWWLDSKEVTSFSITKTAVIGNIFITSSVLIFSIDISHIGRNVYCDARVAGQMNVIESDKPAINVWYAPDVIVNITESTVAGSNVVLTCTAQGEPSQYTFHPWIHRVGYTEIRRLNGINTDNISCLTLPNISIQDMGSYICTVNNSITGLDGQLYQTGDTSLYVQGPPRFDETGSTFKGETGKSASIKIPFYSSLPNITMKIKKNSDSFEMSSTSGVSIYVSPSEITMTFYTVKVMIPGHVAVLNYTNVTDRDFDSYTIHLSNEQGEVSMKFVFLGSAILNKTLIIIQMKIRRWDSGQFNKFMKNWTEKM